MCFTISKRKIVRYVVSFLFGIISIVGGKNLVSAAESTEDVFYLSEGDSAQTVFSLDYGNTFPVTNERFDIFENELQSSTYPNLAMGIKYIAGDESNLDGRGKRRYVYCLEMNKDSPIPGVTMHKNSWADKKITYVLYYGAVYYGEACRKAEFRTGDWRLDYFVTQVAIHVLNNEITLQDAYNSINIAEGASTQQKTIAYDRICKIYAAANGDLSSIPFTQDGWMDMSKCKFSLSGYERKWELEGSVYRTKGVFHGDFLTTDGYDFREQIIDYSISVPEEVQIVQMDHKTYSDFYLTTSKKQMRLWKLEGKTIEVQVDATIPRYWKGAVYRMTPENFQSVCMLTCEASLGTATLSYKDTIVVDKVTPTGNIEVRKYDITTGKDLAGAVFGIYEWDSDKGAYTEQPVQYLQYMEERKRYTNADILKKTESNEGKFLLKEIEPPEGYCFTWERQFQLTEPNLDFFAFEAENYPERKMTIKKRIKKEEVTWAHGNPIFFYRISGMDLKGNFHTYHTYIQCTKEDVKADQEYIEQSTVVQHIPPGIYEVEELEHTMRYILQEAFSDNENVVVEQLESEQICGIEKIKIRTTADLMNKDGSVCYTNRKINYSEYTDTEIMVNTFLLA